MQAWEGWKGSSCVLLMRHDLGVDRQGTWKLMLLGGSGFVGVYENIYCSSKGGMSESLWVWGTIS